MNRLPRVETLLVLACAAGAALLAGSQFTTLFELTPPGGEAISTIEASDQHGYATLVLAVFALVMLVVGIAAKTESMAQIAAFAVAASGAVALLIFLVVDLPDANTIGTLDDARESFVDAEAKPVAGFWFELVGSLILAICGGSLATLGPESFSIGTRGSERERGSTNGATGDEEEEDAAPARRPAPEAKGPGLKRPSLPSLPRLPKLPFGGGRKRIGGGPEKEKPAREKEDGSQESEGFNWPSRKS